MLTVLRLISLTVALEAGSARVTGLGVSQFYDDRKHHSELWYSVLALDD